MERFRVLSTEDDTPIVLKLLGAVVNPDAGGFEDVLVIGALVHILATSPAADIVDQQGSEIGPLRLDIGHEPVQALPAGDVQAASPMVRVNPDDFPCCGSLRTAE
jgi:hypothetical protein